MADKKKQLIVHFAISYFVVSAALFATFILTYRYYFYKIQEQRVLDRARQSEELALMKAVAPFRRESDRLKVREASHLEVLKSLGKIRLKELAEGLKSLSVEEPPMVDLESPDTVQGFIEDAKSQASEERLEALLRPVSKAKGDEVFRQFFDDFTHRTKGLIEFRLFTNGVEQMVPFWALLGSETLRLRAESGDIFKWQVKAYAVPLKQKNIKLEDVIAELQDIGDLYLSRLGIYRFGEMDPLFQGEMHELDPIKLQHYEERALEAEDPISETPKPMENKGYYQGDEVTKLSQLSFLSDPNLKMTLVLNRDIYEPEWTQFSFFERNQVPILVYVVLAWVLCPLLFWWAVRRTNRFQFQFTADYEGDEEDGEGRGTIPSLALPANDDGHRPASSVPSEIKPMVEGGEEVHVLDENPSPRAEAEEADVSVPKKSKGKKPSKTTVQPTKVETEAPKDLQMGPLTRRLKDPSEMLQPLDHSDVDEIRQNNIRKSSGSFNRHQSEGDDVDYLAGVESDVLKSLIKKLREG